MGRMSNPGTKSRDDWETPDALIDTLRREFGTFGLDPCANADNKKAENWFGPGSPLFEDGLAVPWFGGSAYVNPPYGRGVVEKWVEECWFEVACGRMELVVALLPASTSAGWWHQWVMQATEIRLLKGRVRFKGAPSAATWDSVIVIWRKGQLGWARFSGWDWKRDKASDMA